MVPKTLAKKSTTRKVTEPFIGSGILADSVVNIENLKPNAQGIFTSFLAWGFPCVRSCCAVINIFDLPMGQYRLGLSLLNYKKETIHAITTVDIKIDKTDGAATVAAQLPIEVAGPGRYYISCNIIDNESYILLPFNVAGQEWPEFSEKEIAFLKSKPEFALMLRVNVQCNKCSRVYIFEESAIGEKISAGATEFPKSGNLECSDCGHMLNLRDLQGLMRANLKQAILAAMSRGL